MFGMGSKKADMSLEYYDSVIEDFKDVKSFDITNQFIIIESENSKQLIPYENVKKFILFDKDLFKP